MKIHRIRVEEYGPLSNINWELPSTGVVYDDNMTGKTALVDLIVRYLFVPRKGSRLFRNYSRFSGNAEGQVKLELKESGNRYLFGTEGDGTKFKELFEWEEEGLFRLFCIRAGDNRLVSGGRSRSSVFNAAASLISGVGTERLDRIKRDMESEFRITPRGNWSNRKGTHPPKIKDRVNEEILPFLKNFSSSKDILHEYEEAKARVQELESDLDRLKKEKNMREKAIELRRAKKLERHLKKIEELEREKEKYSRIEEGDVEIWRDARSKLERNRERLAKKDLKEKNAEAQLKEIKEKIRKKEKLLDKELNENISSLRNRRKELQKKISTIKREASEKKREAIDFLQNEIRKPLKEVTKLEEEKSELGFWHGYRVILDIVAVGLIFFGGLAAFFISPYFGFTCLPGLALTMATRRKLAAREKLTGKISRLEKEITRKFNSRFDSVLDSEAKGVNQLETIIDLVPDRVEEQSKDDSGLEVIESRKKELEKELNRLKLRTKELPGEIEELKKEKKELSDRISRAKQLIKTARNTLSDLRDRTNLPDLTSLKEKLEEKREIEGKLRDEKAILAGELDSSSKHDEGLLSYARETVDDLRKDHAGNKVNDEKNTVDKDISRKEAKKQLQGLKKKIEQKNKDIKSERKKLEELREVLSEREIDLSSPSQLFRKKLEASGDLKDFIIDRVAGSMAKEALEEVSRDYLNSLDRFISGRSVQKTVQSLFREVMGDQFELNFDYENNEFLVKEGEKSYPESDLSSAGRKHLFLATRLALVDKITAEPGFLVLDDPLLFYHDKRKRKAIKQLEPLREAGWQIIFFSVDKRTRNGVVEELDGKEYSISELVE